MARGPQERIVTARTLTYFGDAPLTVFGHMRLLVRALNFSESNSINPKQHSLHLLQSLLMQTPV